MPQEKLLRQIKERIKQNLNDGKLDQLQLDSIPIREFTREIKNLIESYSSIEYLTLNDCELTSLNNFPKLPNLTILQLSNNKIYDDELFHLLKNSHISHLMIDDNRLKSIQKVSILRQLPNLEQLEISNNLMGDSDFYREELFDRIPQLKIIDCKDKYGNVAIDSESESEDEDNSMIALGENDEDDTIKRKKTNESGNIGDQGGIQLLQLLGRDNIKSSQEQSSQQSSEKDEDGNNRYQFEPKKSTKKNQQNNMEAQQQMTDEKCKKKVKRTESNDSKQCSMQNSKTQVVECYNDDDNDFTH